MRQLYESLMNASRAHAQWEIENSLNIIRNRKKLFILLIFTLPILIPAVAQAASVLPASIGGKSAYGPSFFSSTFFFGSIGVGLIAGLITGCIGAGGGFIITPALMSVGIQGILAVGTDSFHIAAKGIMGTVVQKKMGNVHVGLAIAFMIGSAIGVTGGGALNRSLYNFNPVVSDVVISAIYAVVLGLLGTFTMWEYLKSRKNASLLANGGPEEPGAFGHKIQSINIPPMITFDKHLVEGGRKISSIFVTICGVVTGFFAAMLGVGGGFITFPAFVYGLGISTATTVGTDIFQIIFTSGYSGVFQYAIYGYVFYTLAMGMLLGSLFGIQIGSMIIKVVPSMQIKALYAIVILAGFINRLTALPAKLAQLGYIKLSASAGALITNLGIWIFFILVIIFAVWVFSSFIRNIPKFRAESAGLSIDANKGGISQ